MTARENMMRVFRHQMPAWIPIVGHVDPYNQPSREGMDPELARALGEVQWSDESTIVFSRHLGLDIMDYMSVPLRTRRRRVAVEHTQHGRDTISVWHTPEGDLREVVRQNPELRVSYRVEHMLKGPQDLPALACVFDDEQFEVDAAGAEELGRRRALVGQDGMVMLFMPGTPMGMLVRLYAGVETLAYLWADCRAELRALFEAMERNHARRFRLAASLEDADALVGMDDTSTTAVSPAMFEECCLDYTDRMAELAHAGGKLYFHHSCGLIRDLLPLYRRTRMDAVHGFTVPPIGDVTVGEGRRLLGQRITIIAGAVQLFGDMRDRGAVAGEIAQMFAQAAPGDHFIVGVAADPDKTMEQTRFLVQECKKHRRLVTVPP